MAANHTALFLASWKKLKNKIQPTVSAKDQEPRFDALHRSAAWIIQMLCHVGVCDSEGCASEEIKRWKVSGFYSGGLLSHVKKKIKFSRYLINDGRKINTIKKK